MLCFPTPHLRSIFVWQTQGRKDVGESLEQAALREAYEEVLSSAIFEWSFDLSPLASERIPLHTPSAHLAFACSNSAAPAFCPTTEPTTSSHQHGACIRQHPALCCAAPHQFWREEQNIWGILELLLRRLDPRERGSGTGHEDGE